MAATCGGAGRQGYGDTGRQGNSAGRLDQGADLVAGDCFLLQQGGSEPVGRFPVGGEQVAGMRSVPVTDIVVIAQEAPRQGAGQDVSAHRGPGHGGGGPGQPVRPGDQHPGNQDRRRDDPEIPEAGFAATRSSPPLSG